MSREDVRAASRRFYEALDMMAAGNLDALKDIWSQELPVGALPPTGGRAGDWEAVRESFAGAGGGVRLEDQKIETAGDFAYETGIERGETTVGGQRVPVDHRVTHIYRRDKDGNWKLVHRHADESPAMKALADELTREGAKSG